MRLPRQQRRSATLDLPPFQSADRSHGTGDGTGTARVGRHRGGGARGLAQRPAAGASVESAVLRRPRYAHRLGRHLALPQDADRAGGIGEALRLGAQAGRGQIFPGHAGREMRDRRRGRAVPRSRAQGGAGCSWPRAVFPHQRRRLGGVRARSRAALRARGRDRWAQTLSPRAAQPLGQGDARVVLRSRRTRRGARPRGGAHVRRRLGGGVLRHGASRKPAGFHVMDAALPTGATSHDFFRRARARLTLDVPPALDDPTREAKRGDLDLDPVVDRSEPAVLLTLRTELPSHPGQIAFPGGKIEPQDRSPADAALREAAEEIGLAPALIEPIGYLDLYLTFSGFRILPTVARVAPDYKLVLSEREVADAFEVPLTFLMDAQNHALHSRDWKGVTRKYYAMPFGERYIWGVTAGILRNLYERIYGG